MTYFGLTVIRLVISLVAFNNTHVMGTDCEISEREISEANTLCYFRASDTVL